MSMRELSERLKNWRCERPDEWVMDEFIKLASAMEHRSERAEEELAALRARVAELESLLAEIEAQEPAAWLWVDENGEARTAALIASYRADRDSVPLYTRPVPAHLYCPNCLCPCCINETRSNAE